MTTTTPTPAEPEAPAANRSGPLGPVPGLDRHFHRRPDQESIITNLIGEPDGNPAVCVVLTGAAGAGKTQLALAAVRDSRVLERFEGGRRVFWVDLGLKRAGAEAMEADTERHLRDLAQLLGIPDAMSLEFYPCRDAVRRELNTRKALVVLDNAWRAEQVTLFLPEQGGGEHWSVLLTTSNQAIARIPPVRHHQVTPLSDEEALDWLALRLKRDKKDLPPEGRKIVQLCDGLPMAVQAVAAKLEKTLRGGDEPAAWLELLNRLRSAGISVFADGPNSNSYVRVWRASLDDLPPESCARYMALAVLPDRESVPEAALRVLWAYHGHEDYRAGDLIEDLGDLCLLEWDWDGPGGNRHRVVRLHDLPRACVRTLAASDCIDCQAERKAKCVNRPLGLREIHKAFVTRYSETDIGSDITSVPDDGYYYRWLLWHMTEAGRADRARQLLSSFPWLQAKLNATGMGPLDLLADYAGIEEQDPDGHALRLVRDAIRLSSHVVQQDKRQLGGQLRGRLLGLRRRSSNSPKQKAVVNRLIAEIDGSVERPCLLPQTPALTPPGTPLVRTFEGHTGAVRAVATVDERRAISASADHTVRLWDLESGVCLQTFLGHTRGVSSVAVLPGGRRAVSGSYDGTLRLWDLDGGGSDRERVFTGHAGRVMCVAVLPDGRRAISGSDDGALLLWDLDGGGSLPEQRLTGHTGSVVSVGIVAGSPGRAVSASWDGTVRLWDLDNPSAGPAVSERYWAEFTSVAVVDGNCAVSSSSNGALHVWDLHELQGGNRRWHANACCCVAVAWECRRVVSGSPDGTLYAWDLEGQGGAAIGKHAGTVNSVARVGRSRVISASDDGTLRLWDLATYDHPENLQRPLEVRSVAVVNGGAAISVSDDGMLRWWAPGEAECVVAFSEHAAPDLLDFRRVVHWPLGPATGVALVDGRQAISMGNGKLCVWSLEEGGMHRTGSSAGGEYDSLCLVAVDDTLAISGERSGALRLWNYKTGKAEKVLRGHKAWTVSVAVVGSERVISASHDCTLRLWDLKRGSRSRVLSGHKGAVNCVAVVDQKHAISASADGTLRLWCLNDCSCDGVLEGHQGPVMSVAVLDQERAISASADRTLRLWHLNRKECLAVFTLDAGANCVACAGGIVVAGDTSGRVHRLQVVEAGSGRERGGPDPKLLTADEKYRLRTALAEMGLLKDLGTLPEPDGSSTGRLQKSRVFFLTVEGGKAIQHIVAKFDDEHQAKEWDAIYEWRKEKDFPAALLPLPGNLSKHGVTIYADAGAIAGRSVVTLEDLLLAKLRHCGALCCRALDLVLQPLMKLYSRTRGTSERLQWGSVLPAGEDITSVIALAHEHRQAVWGNDKDEFLQTTARLKSILNAASRPWSDTSHVHGDLNLTNALVAQADNDWPLRAFLIDLANWNPKGHPAIDLARLEADFWQQIASGLKLCDPLSVVRAVRDVADGVRCSLKLEGLADDDRRPARQVLKFVRYLRQEVQKALGKKDDPNYAFHDYTEAMYVAHMRALTWPTVTDQGKGGSPLKVHIALLCASLCCHHLDRIDSGELASRRSLTARPAKRRRSVPSAGSGLHAP